MLLIIKFLFLGRFCDFIFVIIDRCSRKANKLNKDQLVNIFFCFNVCRSRAVDFDYEYALENLINEMNVDELAVVAMGYFKTKTKIKLVPILKAMTEKVVENSKNIHEISLSAILKVNIYQSNGVHIECKNVTITSDYKAIQCIKSCQRSKPYVR